MYPDPVNAHDMNWWFPTPTADNNVYTDSGTTDPFYVWGAHGWGGQLSGMERSDGGSALVEAVGPEPGKIHDAIYASHKGKQAFFLDGKLVVSYEERSPINATEGYFGFSVFESTVMLGAISIGRLP